MSHYHRDELEAYFAGRSGEPESQAVLEHLAKCGACMDLSQRVWDGLSPLQNGWPAPEPGFEPERGRLERRVLRRLHRSGLIADSLSCLFRGMGTRLAAFAQPVTGGEASSNVDKGGSK